MQSLISPQFGPGVCRRCFNFTREPAGELCRACRSSESHLRLVAPVAYAEAGGQLHRALADYKRAAEPAVPDLVQELAALLSAFLAVHERCIAARAGLDGFDCVAVVPSGDRRRDALHPLRHLVRDLVPETRVRFRDLLRASGQRCIPHAFDDRRFIASETLSAEHVLLIDDVWTTGASAQSAAAVLLGAGAASVSAVVIGRYVNGFWGGISERLAAMASAPENAACAFCQPTLTGGGATRSRFLYSSLPARGA